VGLTVELEEERIVDFLATKTDIANLEVKIARLDTKFTKEFSDIELRLSEKMAKNKEDTNEKFEQLRSEMRQQFRWLIGSVIVTLIVVVITAILTKVN